MVIKCGKLYTDAKIIFFSLAQSVHFCKRPCSTYLIEYHEATMSPRREERTRQILLSLPDHFSKVETVLAVGFTGWCLYIS